MLDDASLGDGYDLEYVVVNGMRIDGITSKKTNTTVFVLPGPIAPGVVLDIQYGVRIKPSAEAGTTTGEPGSISPQLTLTHASGPDAGVTPTAGTSFATQPSVSVDGPAVSTSIDTGSITPSSLAATPGQRFNVTVDIALPVSTASNATLVVDLPEGLTVVGVVITLDNGTQITSTCPVISQPASYLSRVNGSNVVRLNLCDVTNDGQAASGLKIKLLVEVDDDAPAGPGVTLDGGEVKLITNGKELPSGTTPVSPLSVVEPVPAPFDVELPG